MTSSAHHFMGFKPSVMAVMQHVPLPFKLLLLYRSQGPGVGSTQSLGMQTQVLESEPPQQTHTDPPPSFPPPNICLLREESRAVALSCLYLLHDQSHAATSPQV